MSGGGVPTGRRRAAGDPAVGEGEQSPPAIDDQARLVVVVSGGGGGGAVDLRNDAIATPSATTTAPVGAFAVGYEEDSGDWGRLRARELIEGAGWVARSLAVQALPFNYDFVNDDFFIARGRVGVTDVRLARAWGTPSNLATSFARLAAGEFRYLVAVAGADGLTMDLLTFSSTSSTRWFQVWDLAATASVPVARGATVPILQVAVGVGSPSAIQLPPGGLRVTNGIVIVASTVPDFYSAPAAGDQDDLAFSVEWVTTYTP